MDFYQLMPLSSTWLCTFYNGVSMGQISINICNIIKESWNVSMLFRCTYVSKFFYIYISLISSLNSVVSFKLFLGEKLWHFTDFHWNQKLLKNRNCRNQLMFLQGLKRLSDEIPFGVTYFHTHKHRAHLICFRFIHYVLRDFCLKTWFGHLSRFTVQSNIPIIREALTCLAPRADSCHCRLSVFFVVGSLLIFNCSESNCYHLPLTGNTEYTENPRHD